MLNFIDETVLNYEWFLTFRLVDWLKFKHRENESNILNWYWTFTSFPLFLQQKMSTCAEWIHQCSDECIVQETLLFLNSWAVYILTNQKKKKKKKLQVQVCSKIVYQWWHVPLFNSGGILCIYFDEAEWIMRIFFSYVMLELSKPQPPEELMDLLVLLYEFQNPRLTAEVLASIRTIRLTNIRMTSLKCFVLSSVLSCASPR